VSKWLVFHEPQEGVYAISGVFTVDDTVNTTDDAQAQNAATQAANFQTDQSAFYPIPMDDRRPYRVRERKREVYFDAERSIPTPVGDRVIVG
jgi:hypothetical protein